MMQRMKGTLRPGRKAGVLALAVLLLTCVLMAGAVSATGEIVFDQSDFDLGDGTYPIGSGGTYVLNGEATGNITINAADGGDVTLKAEDDATLNGGIQIKGVQNVTIEGMHINSTLISGSGPSDPNARNLAITLPSTSIKLCLKNNTIEFAASNVAKGSSVISTGVALSDGSEITGNTILGVTAHVLNTRGVEAGGTLTVQGNTVTMSPNEVIGPGESPQGDGRALLKLFHPGALSSGVTYIVTDNVVSITPDKPDATVVRVDKDTATPDMITVTMYNNTYEDNPASPYLYGGTIYGYDLGELSITVSETDKTRILVPGLNQTGVVWSDGAGVVNQELELNESGSYKLMGDFVTTGSGIQITADDVTLDGSEGKITTAGALNGYILKVAVANTGSAAGVTLQNLDITGNGQGSTGNYGGITIDAGKNGNAQKTSVPVTLKDSIIDMSDVSATGTMNPAVYFVSASNSRISGNTIKAGSVTTSSTRCVVLDGGEGSTVTGNELHLGPTSSKEGSMGVQIKGSSTRNTVSGNTFIAPNDANTDCRAVEITAVKDKDISSSITGNTINFPGQDKSSAVRVVLSSIGITEEENTAVPITLTIENNKGSVKSEVSFWKSESATVKQSYINLEGNKYNPSLTKTEEYTMDAGFTVEDAAQPSTGSVTNNNPNPPVSDGNMNNAYRVLFNDGATTLSVQTDLSSGDKLTKPETPVKDGYTFAGWYKDSACTQAWDFETGISGDMTLYAKWTAAGSSGETEATATPTATATAVTTPQPTKTQTAAATTSAPEATTAAGVSPTLTQAPAPVAGALFGLLAAGVLLRRRFQ